ncbi:MAG: hypothetical protein RIR12_854 [Bacteroidota bacterium]
MKKSILLLFLSIASLFGITQTNYWQQSVDFNITVTLNDNDHSLTGFEKIVYTNNSPDTLSFIWMHLWPNAYKNDKTAFTDQQLENGDTRFYFSSADKRGYINQLDFKVDNQTAQLQDHPNHIDIVKLILPFPLHPHKQITITTPFYVKLPYNFSRGGHDGESYQCTQWYPKPAVYDKAGWHAMPYLDQGEFYNNFGRYEVAITVPSNYVVAATGALQNNNEKEWLMNRANFTWQPQIEKTKTAYGSIQKSVQAYPASVSDFKTLKFIQDNVHDFAWFADKRFRVDSDTCVLASGKKVQLYSYYLNSQKDSWKNALAYTKKALLFYTEKVGEYPYDVLQVVQGPKSFGGGMEYPTITVLAPIYSAKELELTIVHEVGHNWFYGLLASNERLHPWMDEGMNSFYEEVYAKEKYGEGTKLPQLLFETKATAKQDQPIADSATSFSPSNYYLSVYYKAAAWMGYAEQILGAAIFQKAMHTYFSNWKYKHPQPADFKQTLETVSNKNLDTLFAYLYRKGIIPIQQRSGLKIAFALSPAAISSYLKKPTKHLITFSPIMGANVYDKWMVGMVGTNIKLPLSKFNFLVAPMYATGTKQLNGVGGLRYSIIPNNTIKRLDIGMAAATFTATTFKNLEGASANLRFVKIVPSLRLSFNTNSPRSTVNKFIELKSFIIKEDGLRFYRDTIRTSTDTVIATKFNIKKEQTAIHQLRFVVENFRVLYPYKVELKIEQGKAFVRTAFTGNYFFNYPKGGGLSMRLFAGKFFYISPKTTQTQFATDRYHLNMTGANGSEDYTYSDYFIGRNKFDGLASQQIMVRDGAFKVRTDLLADKIGKTDDWLMSVNLTTTFPAQLNPLSVLPFKVPLKVFVDIGTYAEAWKKDAALDRFVFDAGFQLSMLKETIHLYLPLFYSNVYKDYILSTIPKQQRLWKKMSFSIDISNLSFGKVGKNLIY